jgi:hypothetical protein
MATTKKITPTLKPGYWVAATLKPGTAPLRCYVGQIQAIDEKGIRLTLIDWITGMATNFDLFIAHESLESALVATGEHDLREFGERAGKWQEAQNGKSEPSHDRESVN